MKRVILAVMLVCVMSSGAFAVSEDMSVYVRQDVFDAKMEAFFNRIHAEFENIRGDIRVLSRRVDDLDKRMDDFDERIDALDVSIGGLTAFIRYLLMVFGLILLTPLISEIWEWLKSLSKPAVTLDDVQRIAREVISENNARIQKAGA